MFKNMNKNTNPNFRNLYAFGKKCKFDLSLSENPLGCSPRVLNLLKSATQKDFFDYPDPDCQRLSDSLSEKLNVDAKSIFISNGSESIIKLICQVVIKTDDEVVIPELTFPMFKIAASMFGAKILESLMDDDLSIDILNVKKMVSEKTKIIFICNPNNPTGSLLDSKEIIKIVTSTKAIVVVDEANIEFGGKTVVALTKKFKNLVVLRTFSKAFGLAGLRIGFCVANQDFVKRLKQFNQLFPVTSLSQIAALESLVDNKFISKTKSFMDCERQFLTEELRKRGFLVIDSKANNLFIRVDNIARTSTEFIDKLNKLDISLVDGANLGPKWNKFVRMSPRLRKTNRQFLKALDKVLMIR